MLIIMISLMVSHMYDYYLFIYLFIFGCVGSSFLCEGFLQLWQAGATLHRGARASHYRGLSCCGAQAPDVQAQQLWLTGLVAPRHVGSSQTRARTRVPCISRQILNHCATREAPKILKVKVHLISHCSHVSYAQLSPWLCLVSDCADIDHCVITAAWLQVPRAAFVGSCVSTPEFYFTQRKQTLPCFSRISGTKVHCSQPKRTVRDKHIFSHFLWEFVLFQNLIHSSISLRQDMFLF